MSADLSHTMLRPWVLLLAVWFLAGCRGSVESASPQASPAPAGPSGANALPRVSRAQAPNGFVVELVAASLRDVRMLAFSPDGRLFATQSDAGQVAVVPVGGGNRYPWATGLDRPQGIAFHGGYLYVAETDAVVRWPFRQGMFQAQGRPEKIADLPGGGRHWMRSLAFGPDGKLYVSVGSDCNVCIEQDPRRAAILQFNADGGSGRVFASGLRNTEGFTWDEQGRMWGADIGTDGMGADYPPEELNLLRDGGFYGWPYAHADRKPDPRFGPGHADRVKNSIPPEFTFQAHSTPLGVLFYQAGQFPAEYRGELFAALHGSWDRAAPVGYKVVRFHFESGRPVRVTDFLTGFGKGRSAWARPVGLAVGPDGSLYVSDDEGGRIFRVRYTGR